MKKKISFFIIPFLFLISGLYAAAEESTGTRIKGMDSSYPQTVVWFSEPSEITGIRTLLQEGKKELAVQKARDYVARLKNIAGPEAKQIRYFAYNALCAALTSKGDIKEAVDECSRAVKINPSLWQALNTRGTAYYISGQYKLAMKDYKKALEIVKGSESLVDLIQHNIGLTEKKMADSK
ncbi:MAG: tetratricopeptide repeat protein [Desulfatiglans sp.]|nr:tetratricopeptide repeat protein [Desulfatiglans sp.]